MKNSLFVFFIMLLFMTVAAKPYYPKIKVSKASGLTPENALNNPIWKGVQQHQLMHFIRSMVHFYRTPVEQGFVRYLYDDDYFYILAEFTDSDIVTHATNNGGHLYSQGDLLEVFIKPEKANYYWEIYAAPRNLNTRFFFSSSATVGLPSGFVHRDCGIKVFTKIDGTLNDSSDKDKLLTILMAVPIPELNRPHLQEAEKHPAGTELFAPGHKWRIQSARYNYSRYLPDVELSSFPQTVNTYHNLDYFAEIEFVK